LYPNRAIAYPAVSGTFLWLASRGLSSYETNGSSWEELVDVADYFNKLRAEGAVFSNATEVPTNQYKLGSNLQNLSLEPNKWYLVKYHYAGKWDVYRSAS
jgi:hypothetical protein